MHPRFRCAPLADKITDAQTEVQRIGAGTNLFISGFTSVYPKLISRELVCRAEVGEQSIITTDSPVDTSARKLHWYSDVQIIGWILFMHMGSMPFAIRSPRLCGF